MSACDIAIPADFEVRRTNQMQAVAHVLEAMLQDALERQEEQIANLRRLIVSLRQLEKRPVGLNWDAPENVAWNWLLDRVLDALDGLEQRVNDLEERVEEVGDKAHDVLENVGNPGTLSDIATLLREGVVARADALGTELSLKNLSVDNEWHSAAATAYSERAQAQVDEGFDELSKAASALADFLETHVQTEADFWEGFSDLIINIVLFAVGLVFTILGLVSTALGLAAAVPTAGIGLIASVLGIISTIGGVLLTLVSAWMLAQQAADLINDADAALVEATDTLRSRSLPLGAAWPVLAS